MMRILLEQQTRVVGIVRELSEDLVGVGARYGERCRFAAADVRSEPALARVAAELPKDTAFDALIYNAAVHFEQDRRDLLDCRIDDALQTLDVNCLGALRSIKHLRPFVVPRGLIVLVSSEAGSIAENWRPSEFGYCMSKAALNMLSQLLRVREEQAQSGIRVVALHPGWFRSDMGGPNAESGVAESALDIVRTLRERHGADDGPPFVDRFGKAMAW